MPMYIFHVSIDTKLHSYFYFIANFQYITVVYRTEHGTTIGVFLHE